MISARRIALETLRDIERRQGFSNRILAEHLDAHAKLDPRDKGLVTTLVYGVLRHRARLDHHIDQAAHRPEKIKGELREILRLGAYELRELGRPLPIAGDEASKLVNALDRSGKLKGLVTAVLSAIDRDGTTTDSASEAAAPIDCLERRWSIPRWLAGKWIKQLGAETALARGRALAEPPAIDLRVDLSRTDRAAVVVQLTQRFENAELELPEDQPQCIRIRGGADIFRDPLHAEGLISVQGLGSQQAAKLLDPQPGDRVLDACAGMGGKTLHLAERMSREGELVAVDTDARRLGELGGLRTRGAIEGSKLQLLIHEADLTNPDLDLGAPFDRILIDAPCTGLGNLARHPELRWTTRYDSIGDRAQLQARLLEACAARLKPGGHLLYAVCSLEPEEGRLVVEQGLGGSKLKLESEEAWTPEDQGTDGFYVALLRAR